MRQPHPGQHPRSRQFVTLEQLAAAVERAPATLRAYRVRGHKNPMPPPDFLGGGRTPHLWDWEAVRPWLQLAFGMPLPPRYPCDCITLDASEIQDLIARR